MHPSVAIRPEPFGALVYHYGTRKLVFLRSPRIVAVVRTIGDHPSVAAALAHAAVPEDRIAQYETALRSLVASSMLIPVEFAGAQTRSA